MVRRKTFTTEIDTRIKCTNIIRATLFVPIATKAVRTMSCLLCPSLVVVVCSVCAICSMSIVHCRSRTVTYIYSCCYNFYVILSLVENCFIGRHTTSFYLYLLACPFFPEESNFDGCCYLSRVLYYMANPSLKITLMWNHFYWKNA